VQSVYNEFVRPPQHVIDSFIELLAEYSPSCLVADAGPEISTIGGLLSIKSTHKVTGPALTVNLPTDGLVDILPMLPKAQPGDVVVLACHGNVEMAMWGGLMTTLSQMAGIAGAVIDGAIRDVDELRDLDFPIWYRSAMPRRCPATIANQSEPVQVNLPVVIDGNTISPGDIVVADENGVSVVSPALAGHALDATRELLIKEAGIRDRITAGVTLPELLAQFGHI
jgi:4-hydroxy-4-methyl-2-oxoglutarate aldolase